MMDISCISIKLCLCIQPKDAEMVDEKDVSEPHTVVAQARSVTQTSSNKKVIIVIFPYNN